MTTALSVVEHSRTKCRRELLELVRKHSGMQAQIAERLIEVQDYGYWSNDFSSFKAYCGEELGMSLRTAQALGRTYRKCRQAGVDTAEIERLGWSKISLLVDKLTPHNKETLLAEAAKSSYAQLAEKYRKPATSSRRDPSSAGDSNLDNEAKEPGVYLSDTILAALQRASAFTKSEDTQINVEYIAEKFLVDNPRPRDVFERALGNN